MDPKATPKLHTYQTHIDPTKALAMALPRNVRAFALGPLGSLASERKLAALAAGPRCFPKHHPTRRKIAVKRGEI